MVPQLKLHRVGFMHQGSILSLAKMLSGLFQHKVKGKGPFKHKHSQTGSRGFFVLTNLVYEKLCIILCVAQFQIFPFLWIVLKKVDNFHSSLFTFHKNFQAFALATKFQPQKIRYSADVQLDQFNFQMIGVPCVQLVKKFPMKTRQPVQVRLKN